MKLIFYKNISENNVLGKTLTDALTVEGFLKDDCSIIDPTILLEHNIIGYNYLYIPDFNRYYFIRNITVQKNLFRIECHVDVLESSKKSLKKNTGILDRQQYLYNMYLYDPEFVVETDTFTLTTKFDNGKTFDVANYFLSSTSFE